jgi:superfamily I DNA/RNA helicase
MRNAAQAFLDRAGAANVLSLASDYADASVVATLVASVCDHLEAFLVDTGDLALALARFAAEGTVRIMTIHKCKGMEFQVVVLPATESQTWWATRGEERNAFFVGVSRAKDHLLVTHANHRERPTGYTRKWDVARDADAEFVGYVAAEAGGMTEPSADS